MSFTRVKILEVMSRLEPKYWVQTLPLFLTCSIKLGNELNFSVSVSLSVKWEF